MQLKRDTDYAFRILLVMAESATDKEFQGLKAKEICEKTDVPRQIVLRLCNLLSAMGFIKKDEADKSTIYIPESDLPKKTLLDVIQVIEGQTNLFAVFDRRTEIYQRYGFMTESVNNILSNELSKITLQLVLDWEQKKHIFSHRAFLNEYEMKTIS